MGRRDDERALGENETAEAKWASKRRRLSKRMVTCRHGNGGLVRGQRRGWAEALDVSVYTDKLQRRGHEGVLLSDIGRLVGGGGYGRTANSLCVQ